MMTEMKPMEAGPMFRLVICALEDVFYVTEDDLLGIRRQDHIAWPRQVGMAALIDQFGATTTFAAAAFKRRDHTSALHARKMVRKRTVRCHYSRAKVREFLARLAEIRMKQKAFS